ncbi:MAG: hypothetical protein ACXWJU_07090 [Hyphomicrobium sp.]
MDPAPDKPRDRRYRDTHPEHIEVGGKVLERNDVVARRYGESERSVNRRDALGAPYIFISNIKYRPQPDYDEFVVNRCIKVDKPQPRTTRGTRAAGRNA